MMSMMSSFSRDAGLGVICQNDLPPENDTGYNLVKRGDKWSKRDTLRNRSLTSYVKLKYSLTRELPSLSSARKSGLATIPTTAGGKSTVV